MGSVSDLLNALTDADCAKQVEIQPSWDTTSTVAHRSILITLRHCDAARPSACWEDPRVDSRVGVGAVGGIAGVRFSPCTRRWSYHRSLD